MTVKLKLTERNGVKNGHLAVTKALYNLLYEIEAQDNTTVRGISIS